MEIFVWIVTVFSWMCGLYLIGGLGVYGGIIESKKDFGEYNYVLAITEILLGIGVLLIGFIPLIMYYHQ